MAELSVLLPLLFVMHCSKKSKARVPQSELKPTPPARVPLEEPTAQPKLPWCETSTSARSGSSHLCQAAALFSKDSRNLVFNDLSITDMIFLNEFKQATRVVLVGNQIKTLGNQIELDSLESLNLSENPRHVYPKGASEERTPQRCPLENAPSVLIQFCKEGL